MSCIPSHRALSFLSGEYNCVHLNCPVFPATAQEGHTHTPQRHPALALHHPFPALPTPPRPRQPLRLSSYLTRSGSRPSPRTNAPAPPPGERLLQAGRGHPRHPAGRSRRQRRRCQNPGEFPGPHGPKEDQEQRERPEGPGLRGAWRSWGRAGRLGQRPQRRLGQVSGSFPSPGGRREHPLLLRRRKEDRGRAEGEGGAGS